MTADSARDQGSAPDPLRRILVLVPHEPDLDPRIAWSLAICRDVARTDVLATTWSTRKPMKEYDGVVHIERLEATVYASSSVMRASGLLQRLALRPAAVDFTTNEGRLTSRSLVSRLRHHVGALLRLVAAWGYYAVIVSALARRGRSLSVPPKLILCHDLYALIPGVMLKRRWGCRLVYDAHEYFPESDLLAPRWQMTATRLFERHFIRQADAVITVSPPLADEMRDAYDLKRIVAVPNAEPFVDVGEPHPPAPDERIRFLLQGQASPGRGIDRFFELWEQLDDDRAVLLVRMPDGEYPAELRTRFASLFASERAEWLEPVSEEQLVSAARSAHVGVIPYVGPSKNHLYASPNKMSQFMLAGLALFSNELPYISSVIDRYGCGVTYRAEESATFKAAVDSMVGDRGRLQAMREHAYAAARDEFNWQTFGKRYREVIEEVFAL